MRKKTVAIALCIGMAITSISACSSEQSNGQDSSKTDSKETSTQQNDPSDTGSETDPVETGSASAEDVAPKVEVKPLYDASYEDEIRKVMPADLLQYNWFSYYCPLESAGKTDDQGNELKQLKSGSEIKLKASSKSLKLEYITSDSKSYDANIYFYENYGQVSICCEIDGKITHMQAFAPLFYNETRGCLTGYTSSYNSDIDDYTYSLADYYYNPTWEDLTWELAYPEEYGYTTELNEAFVSKDEIIPLYSADHENDIRQIAPEELFDYDKYITYCPVDPADVSEYPAFDLGSLKNNKSFVLNPSPYSEDTSTDTSNFEYYFFDYSKISLTGKEPLNMILEAGKKKATESGRTIGSYYKNLDYSYDGFTNDFAPLFYNKTRGCLVGYTYSYDPLSGEDASYPLTEFYISGNSPALKCIYGFGMESIKVAETPAKIIPDGAAVISLFKAEAASDIKNASKDDLFKFDVFEKYYPIVPSDKEEGLYKLDYGPITLEVEFNMVEYNGAEPKLLTLELYFKKNENSEVTTYYETDGELKPMGDFIPLFYNQVKGCLAGYSKNGEAMSERYCSPYDEDMEGYGGIAPEKYGL